MSNFTNTRTKIGKWVFLMAVFLMSATFAIGQVTTASLTGRVVSATGETLPGATIVATHTPSGTQYGTITNTDGRYSIEGMRVGGPYRIEVSFVGFGKATRENVTLQLGQTFVNNVTLTEESVTLGEVVVTGVRASKFDTEKTGASTNISTAQISTMPTINRNVSDIARLSPYASGMSFAGSDGRSTNFTVDGANLNNNFGLSSNLPGGGNPISLDAIEEIQVVVAPFDVRQTNFIGGGINAITKSGTNRVRGSLYSYFYNQDMRGNKIGDTEFDLMDESKTVLGATLGGPIIKNKLFFFLNGEMEKQPEQVVTWRPSPNGVSDGKTLSRTSISDMEKVKQHLMDVYNYDAGSFTDYPGDQGNRKLMARLDWNINNANKFNVRYNYTKNQMWNPTNGNSTDAGFRNTGMDRISQHSMAFSNSIYSMDNIVNSITGELNSRFSDKLSNQLLGTYTKIKDMRGSESSPFPFIDIMAGKTADGKQILEPYMSAGYELFTWNNGVNNNVYTLTNNLTYYMQNHKLTGGLSYEYQMANNSYMRNGTAYYRYASIEDFLNQRAPEAFALTYGYGGEANPAAEVAFNQFGAYIQDEWNVSNKLKLTLGLRADNITYVDNIMTNNAVLAIDFNGKKINTGEWPTPKVLFSPRLGFTLDVLEDQTLKLRGGTGFFTGRLPLVFFTNMPTNSGMVQGSGRAVTTYNSDGSVKAVDPKLALLAGKMKTDVNELINLMGWPQTITPEAGTLPREIAGVDPDFKMPQVWKSSLALDYSIPASFPLTLTLEGIYTKNVNGVMLSNYSLKQPDNTWQRFSGPDDRYIYPSNYRVSNTNAFVLTNNSDGWGAIGNITLTARPATNLFLMAAYTKTESKEITGMPGSNAGSAYGGLFTVDGPHLPVVQRSQYVVPDKAIGSISYTLPYLNNTLATHFNLFYSGYSPGGYSFVYANDMNGDGYATDLIYIPSAKGDIKFKTPADEDAFFKFVEQDKYLSANKGSYAEAYSARAPWVHRFDFRVAQDINIKVAETTNKLQVSLDFLNIGNLLNNTWGVTKNMQNAANGRILRYEGKDANNVPTFSFAQDKNKNYLTDTYSTNYYYGETWRMQLGLRYIFN